MYDICLFQELCKSYLNINNIYHTEDTPNNIIYYYKNSEKYMKTVVSKKYEVTDFESMKNTSTNFRQLITKIGDLTFVNVHLKQGDDIKALVKLYDNYDNVIIAGDFNNVVKDGSLDKPFSVLSLDKYYETFNRQYLLNAGVNQKDILMNVIYKLTDYVISLDDNPANYNMNFVASSHLPLILNVSKKSNMKNIIDQINNIQKNVDNVQLLNDIDLMKYNGNDKQMAAIYNLYTRLNLVDQQQITTFAKAIKVSDFLMEEDNPLCKEILEAKNIQELYVIYSNKLLGKNMGELTNLYIKTIYKRIDEIYKTKIVNLIDKCPDYTPNNSTVNIGIAIQNIESYLLNQHKIKISTYPGLFSFIKKLNKGCNGGKDFAPNECFKEKHYVLRKIV